MCETSTRAQPSWGTGRNYCRKLHKTDQKRGYTLAQKRGTKFKFQIYKVAPKTSTARPKRAVN